MARHLIIGGAGFVGRHVAAALLEQGEPVTVGVRKLSDAPLPPDLQGASIAEVDLLSADWTTLLGGFDVIHHYAWSSIPQTAAENPVADVDRHLTPTIALLEAARRIGGKRLIFLSSGGTVYGALPSGLASETDHPKPLTVYGATKLAVENYLRVYHCAGDIDCRVARLSNPYGLGQNLARHQGLVSTFVAKALAREPLEVWGDGSVVRDYIHISDVASGLAALSSLPLGATRDLPIFNIASGVGTSVNEVIAVIENALGRVVAVNRKPGRPIDLPVSVLDITRTKQVLQWEPKLTLPDGVRAMMDDLAAKDEPMSS